MDKDNRSTPRIAVSIKMACSAAEGGFLHLHDLSMGGFLARGKTKARVGDALEGTIHIFPIAGDRDVSIVGIVARVLPDGEENVLGVKIESFDGAEGEKAYIDFVRELQEDD